MTGHDGTPRRLDAALDGPRATSRAASHHRRAAESLCEPLPSRTILVFEGRHDFFRALFGEQ
jgi:hypothetical protein